MTKLRFFILMMSALLLASCNGKDLNLTDGDKQVTQQIDDVISQYIVQKYATSYSGTEKQFEVHKVYGTSEKNGVLSVYMWSYYGGFNQATGLEAQSGHSLPAVVRLSQKDETCSVIDYIEPQDGSMYLSSLEKMFPAAYVKSAQRDSGNIGGLEKEMDKKVQAWLEKQES
ncbi:hypothetical protein [Rossellomorea vietnamensis]|uniref:DUF4468 domain-containing protein n=1 Tax=Rossellomorea vietnamensis TaxID=218284 RepID=A0A0N8GGF8_9BACI|nr:hypothetical protein [Rossellomorea vietnamensis]KPL58378.1 hypothetical protein AM506_17330 [Rossellomorea vietnamensis]